MVLTLLVTSWLANKIISTDLTEGLFRQQKVVPMNTVCSEFCHPEEQELFLKDVFNFLHCEQHKLNFILLQCIWDERHISENLETI